MKNSELQIISVVRSLNKKAMSYNFSGGGFMRYYVVRICDNDEETVKILIMVCQELLK